MADWKRELQNRYCSRESLPATFPLFPEEEAFFSREARVSGDEVAQNGAGPENLGAGPREFCVTPYYLSLAENSPDDPIRKQCIPTEDEFHYEPYETLDPLSEDRYSPVPRLIHRYRDRVLILTTGRCPVYCRHCFRRYFTKEQNRFLDTAEIDSIVDYVEKHPEIKEIILSGGDPLMLDDDQLHELLNRFWYLERDLRYRIGTRAPVVLPQRITAELAVLLRRFAPVWVVTHFNHPRELTEESRNAVSTFADIGIPVLNQAVLLKGVNDTLDTLEDLFQELVQLRVKPYYLFQGDIACGTRHFRTSISHGLDLMARLDRRISGLAMPNYAVDLPEGGGKTVLTRHAVTRDKHGWYELTNREGERFRYPHE